MKGMRYGAAVVAVLALAAPSHAQDIEWKQTLNIAKGQNIARERADILGIEFGDSYAEAKAKLQKLDAESIRADAPGELCNSPRMRALGGCEKPEPTLREEKSVFDFRMPGHSVMTATYVGALKLTRALPGKGKEPIRETITVHLSAPSSGHQVVAMRRDIHYPDSDQPQVSALIDALKAKFKAQPHIAGNTVSFQFDEGKPAARLAGPVDCRPQIEAMRDLQRVRTVNQRGDCDVVMVVNIVRGVSQNHARILQFEFGDNERLKANSIADYTYIDDTIRSLQGRTLGATPKL